MIAAKPAPTVALRSPTVGSRLRWLIAQATSFEAFFALSIYVNMLEIMLRTGTSLSGVFFIASAGLSVVLILRDGIPARALWPMLAGLLFVFWALISYVWTPSRTVAPQKLTWLLIFYPWYLIVGTCIIGRSPARTARFIFCVLILGCILSLAGLWVVARFGQFQRLEIWEDVNRVYLLWGRAAAFSIVVAFLLAVYGRPFSMRQLTCFAAVGICGVFLMYCGARSALLAALLGCLPPVLVGLRLGHKRELLTRAQLVATLLMLAAAALVVLQLMSDDPTATIKRFQGLIRDIGDEDKVMQGANRFDYYSSAVRLWFSAPWIGHGVGSFPFLHPSPGEGAGEYPHNMILEILAELGLVGLALFFLLVLVVTRRVTLARLRNEPMLVAIVALNIVALGTALTGFDLVGNRSVILCLALLTLPPLEPDPADT